MSKTMQRVVKRDNSSRCVSCFSICIWRLLTRHIASATVTVADSLSLSVCLSVCLSVWKTSFPLYMYKYLCE